MSFTKFSAMQWDRKKASKWNLVKVVDFILGEDYCVTCWIDQKVMEWR